MKRAAFHNLGCKVNSYETEAMQQRLEEGGYEIVDFTQEADVYVINTCTVTNIADRKSRQMLHRAKKRNPDAIVIAVGCYAQVSREACEKDESVDIVIGNHQKGDIVSIIEEYEAGRESREFFDIARVEEYEDMPITRVENHTRAYIKVQDGCNQFCSYCIIPYARGRVRSRRIESVFEEVEKLADKGYKEIVLTGIHLSSYGVDFAENQRENLLSLMERLHPVQGIERIRLGSLEPRIMTETFVASISRLPKVCPHFHLSLQSGCDSVLRRMNRKYTAQEFRECCERIRKYYELPAITTDVIVGFPGETEEEFKCTKNFLEEIRFFEMHVFKYSKREGTAAAKREDQIPEQKKVKRSDQLLELEQMMSDEFRRNFLHRRSDVLIEETIEHGGKRYQVGHTKEYVKMLVPLKEDRRGEVISVYGVALEKDGILAQEESHQETDCNF